MEGFAARVGANIKRLRVAAEVTQDALAAACTRVGLPWSAVRVAQVESGTVGLPALPTLLLLTAALDAVSDNPVTLADLVTADGLVEIAPGVLVAGHHVGDAVRGARGADLMRDAQRIGGVQPDAALTEVRAGWTRADATVCKMLDIDREVAERVMAELWGRSMSAERDHQAEPNPRSRALATRRLTAELRELAERWVDADE